MAQYSRNTMPVHCIAILAEGVVVHHAVIFVGKRMNESALDVLKDAIVKELQRENAALRQDRQNLERLATERYELLRLTSFALNRVREAAYLLDQTGRLVYVNEEACRTLGYSNSELLQMSVSDIDPDWTTARWDEAWPVLREKGSVVVDTMHRRKNGSFFPVQVNASYFEYVGKEYNLALVRDVSERKEAERRLYVSEQAFRATVEHSPDYIVRYDLQYRRVYANPALLNLIGRPASHVLGTTPTELSALVGVSEYMAALQRTVETGTEVTQEMRLRNAEGRIRWAHVRIVPEFALDGSVASVLAICRDMDDLKRSEQQFRTLTENFPDFVARVDDDGRYLYVNPAVTRAYGLPQEALIGRRPSELPTSDADQTALMEQGLQRAFREAQATEDEVRWQTMHDVRVFETRHVPELDAEGNVVSVLGIGRDITRLRTAELALRASEQAFRTLAENAPDAIVRYDRNCHRTYVNPEFVRVSGVDAEKLLGEPTEVMGATDQVTRWVHEKLKEIMESGGPAKFEVNWIRNGERQCWYAHAAPEYNVAGVVEGVLTIWRDITERKEAEQRLSESYELLRELTSRRETAREEERKRIAREMHDELGQHLTALRMGASTLRLRFGQDNPDLGEHVQKMLLVSDKTMQVLRDVITSLRPAVLDAGVFAALEWLAAEFSQNGKTICRLSVTEEGPKLAEEQAVAIFRIVQEALTNIARHADAKQVFIALEQRGNDYLLEVRDDGRGFDPVAISRNSFGLAGMRERVMMLDGALDVASSRGGGTAIRVRIPIR